MPATIHPQFKKHVEHYRKQGLGKTKIAEILSEKYGKEVKVSTVDVCIFRNGFKKGELNIKHVNLTSTK